MSLTPSATQDHSDYALPPPKPDQPCRSGSKLDEATFKSNFKGRAWLPDSAVASHSNLLDAWNCLSVPVLRYAGLTIGFEPGWKVPDPKAWVTDAVKNWQRGSVTTAAGRPAFVEPGEDGYGAELILFVGPIQVEAIATDLSITAADLVAMVESMGLPPS